MRTDLPVGRCGVTVRNPQVRAVSAFFPCYNDELAIPTMVRGVRRALLASVERFEIIVVDDGSSDGSVEALRGLQGEVPELRIVEHGTNRGYGGALISGFQAAVEEWVFYTDGDAQYDATEVTALIDVIGPDIDIAQGFKIGRGDSWYRKVIGRAYHHTVRALFGLHVRDTDCDFRLIRRQLLERVELVSTSGVICVEMMWKLQHAGARFAQVGVSHHQRPHGRSQFFRLPAITRSARQLLTLWWTLILHPTLTNHRRRSTTTTNRIHPPTRDRPAYEPNPTATAD
jgi:glycosyltransferase involved in cell wall biosynthesis